MTRLQFTYFSFESGPIEQKSDSVQKFELRLLATDFSSEQKLLLCTDSNYKASDVGQHTPKLNFLFSLSCFEAIYINFWTLLEHSYNY